VLAVPPSVSVTVADTVVPDGHIDNEGTQEIARRRGSRVLTDSVTERC